MHKMVNGQVVELTPAEIAELEILREESRIRHEKEALWHEWKAAKVTTEEFMIQLSRMFLANEGILNLLSQTDAAFFRNLLQHLENEPEKP